MKVTCEINDYSTTPAKPSIRVHNHPLNGNQVELEVDSKRYVVSGDELISAIKRCMLDVFGK